MEMRIQPPQELDVLNNDLLDDGFVGVREASAFLGLSRAMVYGLMDSQAIPFAKFGRARRIPRRGLVEFARSCLVGASPGSSTAVARK
jgi:excisionase family DNA binding protein